MARTIDELDRVTLADYPGTDLDVAYTYDDPLVPFSKGRLTALARDGQAIDYGYDRFGRVTQDGALGYQYDANGNRIAIEYPGGVTAVSTFDYADRPTSLTVQRPGEPDLPIAAGAAYEPAGPLISLDLGNGLTEIRPYTDRYFPIAISVEPTTPLIGVSRLNWNYSTDDVGNILTIGDGLTPANDKAYTYQDHQYFLTGGTGPWGDLAWTYDRIGNRLTENRDGVTDTYAYTSNGSGNTGLLSTITLGLGGTRGYTYGPAGHLEQVTAPTNQVHFLSDAAGRLTRLERLAGDARSDFLYDGRSFLRWAEASPYSVLFSDGFESADLSCWSVVIDGALTRGAATCPRGPQLDAVYSSEGLLHAVTHRPQTGPATTRYYLYLAGRPVAQLDVDAAGIATPTWLTTDHLGTPVLATDASGTVLWQGGFEPFGADYSGASAAGVDLRFPGQWEDGLWGEASAGAGVVHNVYRWYEPGTGRYGRIDPLGIQGDQNLFVYGLSNPLLRKDPLGLQATAALELGCSLMKSRSSLGVAAGVLVIGGTAAVTSTCKDRDCGDCSPAEHAALQLAVELFCKTGPRACDPGQGLASLLENKRKNINCAAARDRINKRCFNGGDLGHQRASADAWQAVANCVKLIGREFSNVIGR